VPASTPRPLDNILHAGLPGDHCRAAAHPEIAAALGISTANLRVLLHRGRTAPRELLKKNCVLSFDSEGMPCERRSWCR